MKYLLLKYWGCLCLFVGSGELMARSYVTVVGSSTVYPFTTVVAERFGHATGLKTPKVESTGTGGGFKLFCQGLGLNTPDITNASRPIKAVEKAVCADNGVDEVTELLIGYDGIVLANHVGGPDFDLEPVDLYLALADALWSDRDQDWVPNPHTSWNQINPRLPDVPIQVLGPPPTSGTRDAFVELIMMAGCAELLGHQRAQITPARCQHIREDGHYVEIGESDNLVINKLKQNVNLTGIVGFSFLKQHRDWIKGAKLSGYAPTQVSIENQQYPISRPLYLYVKKAHSHHIPGLLEFVRSYASPQALGVGGYLSQKGLIPLSESQLSQTMAAANRLTDRSPRTNH